MANTLKKSDHIRIRGTDKKTWLEYCKALKTNSPELFHKMMHSPNLKLNEKVLEELKKQEREIERKIKLGI